MTLPSIFRKALVQCVQNNFTEIAFVNLTRDYSVGISFQDGRPTGANYFDSIGPYLDEVAARGFIAKLVDAIKAERGQDADVIALDTLFLEIFTPQGNKTKFNDEVFIKEVLKKQSQLFIARDHFAKGLARMVNEEKISLLGLRGQPKTGLSYVSSYLGDIQDDLNCFKFLNINLKEVGESYPQETVTAAHLAELITSRLGMSFTGIKDFKLSPFLGSLEKRLDELAQEGEKWLFFFDQFSYPCSNDVKTLLKKMGRMVYDHKNAFYLVFSAYENWQQDWEDDVADVVELLDFRPFTEQEIQQYLDQLYNTKEINFRAISKDTFLAGTKTSLSKDIYNPPTGSNVPVISKELRVWFREIKNMLPK